ncbi:retrovirus-related pol polyprotein from transposon TNT 1-94 [Tanacetum coccineum]
MLVVAENCSVDMVDKLQMVKFDIVSVESCMREVGCSTAFCRIWGCILVAAFWLLKVAFCLLEDLTAFCFKTSLRFASRPHCILLQDLIAFCFKTSLRFASRPYCVLLQDHTAFYFKTSLRFASRPHCVLLQDLIAFCFKLSLRFASTSLRFAQDLHCVLLEDHIPLRFLGTTRDALGTTSEEGVLLGPERPHTYEDLSDTEKKRYDADVRATNIVLQGLPKDIYKLINHNIEAKAIWDNVKMLLAGSELTKEDRESQLYDEFERFKMLPGENINEYYVRFHKLVNDMRNIRMTMPNIQLNSKFVNNMSPEWDRFVTAVKLNKGLKETNHEQLYAYLKQHEKHAAQDRLIIERITPATNDQLAFVSTVQPHAQSSHVQSHQYPSSSTNPQSLQYPQFPETSQIDSGYTQTDEILDNLTKQMALLAQSFRATLPQTNNQLRTSSNTRNQATIQDGRVVVQNVQGRQNQNQRYFSWGNSTTGNGGAQNRAGNANAGQGKPVKCYNCNGVGHIARNCTQPKRPQNSDYFKDKMLLMQAQENGAVLDEEELLFLADECDAFDSDVDDEPTAQTIFMANLSSAGSANLQAGPSNASILSEVVQIVLWYLDSGCSKHMTGDHSRLRNFMKKFIGIVQFGNDHFGAIMGYGDYVIGDSVISRVYYVEGLGHNLFSVGQFCDSDLEFAFRKHTCFVRDLDGVDLIKGSRGTNLYTISVKDMMRSSPI